MTTVGGYVLDEQIGAGAAGTVWRAHREGPGPARPVAVKRLRAGAAGVEVDRLRREAAILTELDHPHVMRVFEVVDDDDGIAVVMQYAPGGSLADLLAERGRLTGGEVVAVAAPVADALASAHRRGVLHGDVKPANVLFTSDGEPLLSDFGVSRRFGRPVTADHGVAGTAEYLAPELLDGHQPDPRADVYALGVLCYEALAGTPPFTGPTPLAVIRAADRADHPPLASVATTGVPPALAVAVERALARTPADRFQGAEDLARALRSAVPADAVRLPGPARVAPLGAPGGDTDPDAGRGTRTFGPRPPRRKPASTRRRRRWPVLAAAGGLALAAAVVVVVLVPTGDDDEASECEPVATGDPGGQVVEGDTDGNGTPTTGVYRQEECAMVLTIAVDPAEAQPRRYQFGQPGDELFLGDWNCDGVDTPALYRSTTGDTLYYDSWATESGGTRPSSTAPGTPDAEASLSDTNGDGCDEIVLVAPA